MTSCAAMDKDPIRRNGYKVELEFVPIIQEFERVCGKPVNLHVTFADLWDPNPFSDMDTVAGLCFPFFAGDVYIDREVWESFYGDYYRQEELLFHELGHCVLWRLHNNEVTELGMEKSIMSSVMFRSWYQYEIFREEYIKELCK